MFPPSPPPSLGSCFPLICIGRLQQHQDAAPYSVHLIIYGTNLHKYAPLDLHRVSFPRRRRRRRWEVEGGRENPILGRVKRLAGLRRCHPVNFTLSKTINLGSNEISLWRQVGHHVMLTHQSDGPRPPWLLPLHI